MYQEFLLSRIEGVLSAMILRLKAGNRATESQMQCYFWLCPEMFLIQLDGSKEYSLFPTTREISLC